MSHHQSHTAATHPSGFSQDQIDALEAEFAAKQTAINLACIPVAIVFALLTHGGLLALSRIFVNSDGLTGYRVPYQSVIWWLFPGFGALSLCFEIVLQLWALFAGHRIVDLYAEWDSRQPKKSRGGIVYYDARRTLRVLSIVIALPVGILSTLALNMHTTFTQTQIYEFGYSFKKPIVHPYSDLRRVGLVESVYDKHHDLIRRPAVVLDFEDGYRWSQRDWDDTDAKVLASIDIILKAGAGSVPHIEALTINDLPPI